MRLSTFIFAAVVLAIPASSAPASSTPRAVQKFDGETTGKYVVKLKDGVSHASVLGEIDETATHSWTIINGFAGEFSPESLDIMLANPDVEYISEDAISSIGAIQTDASWGLSRLSSKTRLANQNARAVDFRHTYTTTGTGVDVYVVDTGVRTTHSQFGGRATWGNTFIGTRNVDMHGHGTHCAGTVAGSRWGVAKEARIIAVKVLGDDGRGSLVALLDGLQWVTQNAAATRRPSVISMSLGFAGAVAAADSAVESVLSKGVHVVIAAMNDNVDAGNVSPARVGNAITVAASTIGDQKAGFSNWGAVIDIFAPGQDVISAGIASDVATTFMSGTSMATPHVAGLIANLIARDGNTSPAVMATKLKTMGLRSQLSGVPAGTVNLLAQGIY